MEELKFCKVRNVRTMERAHSTDAGLDFFFPNELKEEEIQKGSINVKCNLDEAKEVISVTIYPQGRILIPSGIHVKLPENHALILFNKSGISSKEGLDILACVIDENYEGECHISLCNTGKDPVILKAGQKLTQAVLIPITLPELKEYNSLEELYPVKSSRGIGGFGSSDVVIP